jgi:RimJ/RimL family protein N-acetyltransferase
LSLKENIEFIPIASDGKRGFFRNAEYLPFVLGLFQQYKSLIIDDNWICEGKSLFESVIDEINQMYPFFQVILFENRPAGAVWLTHVHGNNNKIYSCQIHGAFEKKYFGKKASIIAEKFFEMLFNDLKIERVQVEIDENNIKAVSFMKRAGFMQEGVLRHAGIKNKKPVNHVILSLLKGESNYGKR